LTPEEKYSSYWCKQLNYGYALYHRFILSGKAYKGIEKEYRFVKVVHLMRHIASFQLNDIL
jgi:hypothetical protein